MKLGRPHLIASLAVLGASIVWNVWVFTKPDAVRPGASARTAENGGMIAGTGGTSEAGPIDPAAIAAPPPLDLTQAPAWARNPFAHRAAQTVAETAAAQPAPAPALPVLGAILFSEARRSAIIDGRIVGVGDRIQGGVVVSISRTAVVVELASGERVTLGLRWQ